MMPKRSITRKLGLIRKVRFQEEQIGDVQAPLGVAAASAPILLKNSALKWW